VTEDQRPLFRLEAIEAHARGRGVEDEGLELKEGRTKWAFRLLCLAILVTVLAGFTVSVDQTARGYARVPAGRSPRSAVVDLPIGALPRLAEGKTVRLHDARGKIVHIGQPSSTKEGEAIVPVLVDFTEGEVVEGEATVLLARQTLVDLLLRRNSA
jgi:hypothetical protein